MNSQKRAIPSFAEREEKICEQREDSAVLAATTMQLILIIGQASSVMLTVVQRALCVFFGLSAI